MKPEEIVNIEFAFRSFGGYSILFKIEKKVQQGQALRTKERNTRDLDDKKEIEEKITKVKDEILDLTHKYLEWQDEQ